MHLPVRSLVVLAVLSVALFSGGPVRAVEAVQLDVPYVPTPQTVVDRMLELAEVRAGDYLIDLGSGDGRIPITAARRHGIRALGVDLDPERIREAQENSRVAGVADRVEFRQQDLFDTKIAGASVVTMYLLPVVNLKLRPRLLYELKPGTRIVSHAFRLGDWEPDHAESLDECDLFLWIVPAKVEGRWRITAENPFVIELTQAFQAVSGVAIQDGRSVPLEDVSLRGTALSFRHAGQRYRGRVDGFVIEAVAGDGLVFEWRGVKN